MLPIHGTEYAMRLWPGSFARSEHCLDFIETRTKKPINVPEGYTIWFMPDPSAPWLQGTGPVELVSIERSFGMLPADIPVGEEKYILKDGMTCMLTRPGARAAIFAVPLRYHQHSPYRNFDVITPTRGH